MAWMTVRRLLHGQLVGHALHAAAPFTLPRRIVQALCECPPPPPRCVFQVPIRNARHALTLRHPHHDACVAAGIAAAANGGAVSGGDWAPQPAPAARPHSGGACEALRGIFWAGPPWGDPAARA